MSFLQQIYHMNSAIDRQQIGTMRDLRIYMAVVECGGGGSVYRGKNFSQIDMVKTDHLFYEEDFKKIDVQVKNIGIISFNSGSVVKRFEKI